MSREQWERGTEGEREQSREGAERERGSREGGMEGGRERAAEEVQLPNHGCNRLSLRTV